MKLLLVAILFASTSTCSAEPVAALDTVLAEDNLEKRSDLALKYADTRLDAAREAYAKADPESFRALMGEFTGAVELSYESLQESGKKARRNPKYFKRAEKSIRKLLARLETLTVEVAIDDRPTVTTASKRLNEIHDQLILDIMTKK
jgi:hypothetical protein